MVHFLKIDHPSTFRKLAASMWVAPNDPHIFGFLDVDMIVPLAFAERHGQEHGCKLTVTHMVVRAVAMGLARHPELNA